MTKYNVNQIIKDLKMHHSLQFENICKPLCTYQHEREEDVLDSRKSFLCLIANDVHDYLELRVLRPYIAKSNNEAEPEYVFGWVRADGNYVVDNKHNPVTGWANDPVVVGFKEVE
jgi:hypothetical protein